MEHNALKIFIERDILPIYDSYDAAHDTRHVRAVMEKAVKLAEHYNADPVLLYTAAAYHDLGLCFGRETHHLTSARMLREDDRLDAFFTPAQKEEMAQAIEDHRASAQYPPRSLNGRILADADREYSVARIIGRTMCFGLAKFPEMPMDAQVERAEAHLREKYLSGGYLKFWLEDPENETVRQELETLVNDPAAFRAECLKYAGAHELSVQRYLERIGINEPARTDAEFLNIMQMRHLRSVPYENLDILAGIPLSQDYRQVYDKVVLRRRGGYCFELNELFGWLLRSLHYRVVDCFARFLAGCENVPKRRHHVLIVSVPGDSIRWLCDVGVGSGSPTYPVKLIENIEQAQPDNTWKLNRDAYLGWVLKRKTAEGWQEVFSFTEEPQLSNDFETASYFCEHSPDSPFNKAPMVSLRTEYGRVTIAGDEKRVFCGDEMTATPIEDLNVVLRQDFGIELAHDLKDNDKR